MSFPHVFLQSSDLLLSPVPCLFSAQRAKLLRLEKETREMEKNMEALRHSQAKVAELEKTNKKLYAQSHADRKGIIKLKEVPRKKEMGTVEWHVCECACG